MRFPYEQETKGIVVRVYPAFSQDHSDPEAHRYFWTYTIEIANRGDRVVQLLRRHWRITDANGQTQEVIGDGVVGEQPTLGPGERFRYTSGAPLPTPSGMMAGAYLMTDATGRKFEVAIPAFSLDLPDARPAVN
jgi:Uncharacterized protein affecting Mg2+/Co2+ transport